uniref:Uncharacterized protein n=1 Tax=Candidatus Kentrum sp. FW TaxID=2126338 RepID=A0A450SZQ8_9GAMM|nr:MAG: hypothetical protein BECKFW1821A_GA0114235_10926 [Candidatus Kentron sp. FW]VFJ68850.1 MAG: hypothetical protein BECKFW1821B_GA0114236_11546 [Candidatus Kentron sp. FW]
MSIEFDSAKRDRTLKERGLDFARCAEMFAGHHFTAEDTHNIYGEKRYITVGKLDNRMLIVVWTPRGYSRRIISMRKANEREQACYIHRLG